MVFQKCIIAGLPGAGKTSLVKNLEKLKNFEVIDLDEVLAEQEKLNSAAQIIEQKGLNYFRQIESQFLLDWLNEGKTNFNILVFGGGTLSWNNFKLLHQDPAIVKIHLDISPKIAFERTWNSPNRPIANSYNKDKYLELLVQRYQILQGLDYRINGLDEISNQISQLRQILEKK